MNIFCEIKQLVFEFINVVLFNLDLPIRTI